jgi:hypothetical protein
VNRIAKGPVLQGRVTNAVVAQLAEQLIRNQQVAGSNPANGSIKINDLQRKERPARSLFSRLTAFSTGYPPRNLVSRNSGIILAGPPNRNQRGAGWLGAQAVVGPRPASESDH